ncbi:Gag Pol polyprotein [Plakobranchus ocellatus]|uniref:Gag Pol polyprotein n=1 Tax=Plakobranchus ocellatus TaxID=259542 RepID=A0AAV4DRD7_9GAST|nr:Gag Pol polyprotein [Plakobranchus ocellatus]
MSSESAIHKRNLESSILFMQQEHAAILKGLHEEIGRLQKRCTDLTFQLTMHGLTIDEPGSVDSQMQQVQQELEISRTKIATLEKELLDRDKRVERLETEARSQRKRWLDESRAQSQTMNTLRAELEAKANNIAYLTTELHRLKQKGRAQEQGEAGGSQVGVDVNNPYQKNQPGVPSQPVYLHPDSGKKSHPQHFVPAPPQREKTLGPGSGLTRMRRSGGHSRSLAGGSAGNTIVMATGKGMSIGQGHPASADAHLTGRQHHNPHSSLNSAGAASTAVISNPNNPLRVSSGRSSGSDSPDITPFLPPPPKEDALLQELAGKQAPVLPPIPVSGGSPRGQHHSYQGSLGSGSHHQVLVHKVVSSTTQRQMKTGASAASKAEAAVVTLAVENAAAPPDTAWALAQESRGSEYN